MTPAISWPGTRGVVDAGMCPSTVTESVWQTPHASTRTRTSPRPGSGTSRSTSSSLPPAAATWTACMRPTLASAARGPAAVSVPTDALQLARAVLRGLERDLRHAARPHPGARQARGGARAARAAAPARRAAADRARLGDARRCRRPTARARSSSRSTCTRHEAVVEHSDGRAPARSPLTPDRPVGEVTRELLAAVRELGGAVEIDPTPQEVPWTRRRSTRTTSTRPTTPAQVAAYFAAATRAALVLAAFRAPYRGRSTPVNAWWGSFDLAVSLFSGAARRPAVGRLHHAQRDGRAGGRGRLVAGRRALRQGRLLRLRAPGAGRLRRARRSRPRPRAGTASSASTSSTGTTSAPAATRTPLALEFARSAFRHACAVCEWDPALAASAEGTPPPVV